MTHDGYDPIAKKVPGIIEWLHVMERLQVYNVGVAKQYSIPVAIVFMQVAREDWNQNTHRQIMDETGLGRSQVKHALKTLLAAGEIEIRCDRLEHQTWYRATTSDKASYDKI